MLELAFIAVVLVWGVGFLVCVALVWDEVRWVRRGAEERARRRREDARVRDWGAWS